MKTLLVVAMMVHAGHHTTWTSHRLPAHHDVALVRVTVNHATLVMGDFSRAVSFMYGHGLAVRFVAKPGRRFVITASSVRKTDARLRVTYRIKHA